MLVLWLDNDREGENICFEVMQNVLRTMNKGGDRTVWRSRFSSLTDADIRRAMNALTVPNENEALSVDARQILDLKVGVAFTRYQTRYFQGTQSTREWLHSRVDLHHRAREIWQSGRLRCILWTLSDAHVFNVSTARFR